MHIFNFLERAASSIITLKEDEISRVTDIIPADNRLRFSVEYLGIDGNEYRIIESDAKYNHHDTLHECIRRWRNRTEAQGFNTKDELIRILTEIRQTRGWFPFDAMSFLTDVSGMHIPASSKELFIFPSLGNLYYQEYPLKISSQSDHPLQSYSL